MGRPREHDEETRAALRAATERIVAESGIGAFSVRAVAREVGTTTRAVYSLFGSKEGLLVDALAQSAFEFLADGIDELPETDDPVADLVAVGIPVFRSLVLEHPALYRIAFQRIAPNFTAGPEVVKARERALAGLVERSSASQRSISSARRRCSRPLSSSMRCSRDSQTPSCAARSFASSRQARRSAPGVRR